MIGQKNTRYCHIWTLSEHSYTHQRLKNEALALGLEVKFTNPSQNPPRPESNDLLFVRHSGLNYQDHELELAKIWKENKALKIVNAPESILELRDKLKQFHFLSKSGLKTPRTWPLTNFKSDELPQELEHFVVKPLRSNQGKGLIFIHGVDSLKSLVKAFHDLNDTRFVIQEQIPKIKEWRLFCWGAEQKILWIEKLIEGKNSVGNREGFTQRLLEQNERSSNQKTIETQLKKITTQLHYWGADVLEDQDQNLIVLEINTVPGLHGPEELSRLNIAKEILQEQLRA